MSALVIRTIRIWSSRIKSRFIPKFNSIFPVHILNNIIKLFTQFPVLNRSTYILHLLQSIMGNTLRNFGFSISLRMSGGVDFIPAEPEVNNDTSERVVVVEAANIREGRFQGHSRGCPNRDNVHSQSILGDPPVSQQNRSQNNRPRPPPYSNSNNN